MQAWITLHVTLQPPGLDAEESEWIFDNVLPTVHYTICNSTTVQVEQAPLEMFTLSSVVTKAHKWHNDNFSLIPSTSFLPVINKELFYHQIFSPLWKTVKWIIFNQYQFTELYFCNLYLSF